MKKMILSIIFIILVVGCAILFYACSPDQGINCKFEPEYGIIPENGYVPDEETAIKIAEAVWLPIYGENIYDKQPFKVEFIEKINCWKVVGTLPEIMVGGVPEIVIKKSDGQIVYVIHGK